MNPLKFECVIASETYMLYTHNLAKNCMTYKLKCIWFHPASYVMCTGDCFSAARAWNQPVTFIYCRGEEWWKYTPTPHTSSWVSA
jgi:hypothetical protein